jgi:hypothetical protein
MIYVVSFMLTKERFEDAHFFQIDLSDCFDRQFPCFRMGIHHECPLQLFEHFQRLHDRQGR